MPQVNIATSVAPQEFPAGTVLGQMRFRLLTQAGIPYSTLYVDVPLPPVVTFSGVAAGDYTLKIQRLTANSLPTGPEYSAPITVVSAPPVMGDVPTGATVSVA